MHLRSPEMDFRSPEINFWSPEIDLRSREMDFWRGTMVFCKPMIDPDLRSINHLQAIPALTKRRMAGDHGNLLRRG